MILNTDMKTIKLNRKMPKTGDRVNFYVQRKHDGLYSFKRYTGQIIKSSPLASTFTVKENRSKEYFRVRPIQITHIWYAV